MFGYCTFCETLVEVKVPLERIFCETCKIEFVSDNPLNPVEDVLVIHMVAGHSIVFFNKEDGEFRLPVHTPPTGP